MTVLGFFRKEKTKREIIINAERLETRVAILEEGRLEEFEIEHPAEERIVGSIYKGVIQNLENDLQAAFVDIGFKKNAFLHYWDMVPDDEARLDEEDTPRRTSPRQRYTNEAIAQRFPVGSEIVVQVTKGPIGTKGPRVTANLSIPGRFLVMMPGSRLLGVSRKISDARERQRLKKILGRLPVPAETGLIVRTVGAAARKTSFVRDLAALIATWEDIQTAIRENRAPCCVYQEPDLVDRVVRDWLTEDVDRIMVDARERFDHLRQFLGRVSRRTRSRLRLYEGERPIFEHFEVERQIEEAFRRKVNLKSGGYIVLDETEALIAIDVNTGRHKGGGTQEATIVQVNTEAVVEVARQLRLRNIGGLVVIDLIDMRQKRHQNAVYRALKTALKRDRARTNVMPISGLGLLEMTRQRAEESVRSVRYVDCPYCHGRGEVKSSLTMSVEVQRQIAAVMRRHRERAPNLQLQVLVHPSVLERLRRDDEQALIDLQSQYGGRLAFRADPNRHIEGFAIKNAETGDVLHATVEH